MNILILNRSATKFIYKSDSSLCANNSDYYIPDGEESMRLSPLIAVKINKSAKMVSEQFADRYYNSLFSAIHIFTPALYQSSLSAEELSMYIVMEKSFYLNDKLPINQTISSHSILCLTNTREILNIPINSSIIPLINKSIELATSYTTLKTGDIVALTIGNSIAISKGDIVTQKLIGKEDAYLEFFDFLIK